MFRSRVPTKKLVVSTYLQYILIAVGALLLFTFVRQSGGVLLTFLLAGVMAYALNPLIRRLEATLGIPRVASVLRVFLELTVTLILAEVVLIVPGTTDVHPLWVLFAILAAAALYGIVGAVFVVPIVATISAACRHLRETLGFERWGKASMREIPAGAEGQVSGEARKAVPAGEICVNHPEEGDGLEPAA